MDCQQGSWAWVPSNCGANELGRKRCTPPPLHSGSSSLLAGEGTMLWDGDDRGKRKIARHCFDDEYRKGARAQTLEMLRQGAREAYARLSHKPCTSDQTGPSLQGPVSWALGSHIVDAQWRQQQQPCHPESTGVSSTHLVENTGSTSVVAASQGSSSTMSLADLEHQHHYEPLQARPRAQSRSLLDHWVHRSHVSSRSPASDDSCMDVDMQSFGKSLDITADLYGSPSQVSSLLPLGRHASTVPVSGAGMCSCSCGQHQKTFHTVDASCSDCSRLVCEACSVACSWCQRGFCQSCCLQDYDSCADLVLCLDCYTRKGHR